MAYSYTNSGITFRLPEYNKSTTTKYGKRHQFVNDFSTANEDGVAPFINAVEIDWNSAKLGQTTINTTGESRCSMIVRVVAA